MFSKSCSEVIDYTDTKRTEVYDNNNVNIVTCVDVTTQCNVFDNYLNDYVVGINKLSINAHYNKHVMQT